MEEYMTAFGRRPDLEAMDVAGGPALSKYIGNLVYPPLNVLEKTGTIYFKSLVTDSAAQTGRSSGTAPTATVLTESHDTFTCAEKIKRYAVGNDEVKQMGGVEMSDMYGGKAAKRSVLRAIESAQAAVMIDAASYAAADDISGAIIDGFIGAAESVRRYEGKLALVLSEMAYRFVIQQDEIKTLMGRFVGAPALSPEQILSVDPSAFKNMLRAIYLFDEVLVGLNDHWAIAGKEDAAVVCKLPDPEQFSHKLDPVLGKTALYLPDGSQPFVVESFYNYVDKANDYDAQAWVNVKEFNSGAKKVVAGLGSGTT